MHVSWPVAVAVSFLLVISLCLNIYLGTFLRGEGGIEGRYLSSRNVDISEILEQPTSKEVRAACSWLLHEPLDDGDHFLLPATGPLLRLHASRLLSDSISSPQAGSSTSGASESSSGGHDKNHEPHQHDSLLFLFNAIFVGTAVLHLASYAKNIQVTVILFIIGMVTSLFLEGLDLKEHLGVFGASYSMWMNINPHLLLFTLLPMLLAGDAMTIDTQVAKRVVLQCLYLAGPGVLVSALLVGTFLKVYLDWTFLLSMVTASILCATDPVAVVSLLKELGASPILTVQIQGESLLNDGTAIVLYTVCYNMLSGEEYDYADIIVFLMRTAMLALALGTFLGYLFFSWIRLAGNRFNHDSTVIQILLTFCAAYWSFCLAEGVLKMSGVLSTVGCSIVLAHHMWPFVVHPETLVHFWHTLENMGNIIIFLLGGALTGVAMLNINFVDIFNLGVIYIVLMVVRGGFIFASRPLLRVLHRDKLPVSFANAVVMTWGGLRGAVGLALAMAVNQGRAMDKKGNEQISTRDAERVLFFVAGIGFLTTVLNATTCPALVTWLGITALPAKRHQLLRQFHSALVDRSLHDHHPAEVNDMLMEMLGEIETNVEQTQHLGTVSKRFGQFVDDVEICSIMDIKAEFNIWESTFLSFPEHDRQLVQNPPKEGHHLGQVAEYFEMLQDRFPCEDMCKAVVQLFMSLVLHNYWKLMETEELQPGSPETDVLFTSIQLCLTTSPCDLVDLATVMKLSGLSCLSVAELKSIQSRVSGYGDHNEAIVKLLSGKIKPKKTKRNIDRQRVSVAAQKQTLNARVRDSCIGKYVLGIYFDVSCGVMVVFNTLFVIVEEVGKDNSNDEHIAWTICEAFFVTIFALEFVLKLVVYRCKYWRSFWRVYDFLLVVLGILGMVMSAATSEYVGDFGASEARVIRIARFLRAGRFMRVIHVWISRMDHAKVISEDLAQHIYSINCLEAFVNSHLIAQGLILKYMGAKTSGDEDDLAIARCILQSQAAVYKALVAILCVQQNMDSAILRELKFTKERKRVVEGLQSFVNEAQSDGVLTGREAAAILHPLEENITQCLALINQRREGCTHSAKVFSQAADSGKHGTHKAKHETDKQGQIMLSTIQSKPANFKKDEETKQDAYSATLLGKYHQSPGEQSTPFCECTSLLSLPEDAIPVEKALSRGNASYEGGCSFLVPLAVKACDATQISIDEKFVKDGSPEKDHDSSSGDTNVHFGTKAKKSKSSPKKGRKDTKVKHVGATTSDGDTHHAHFGPTLSLISPRQPASPRPPASQGV